MLNAKLTKKITANLLLELIFQSLANNSRIVTNYLYNSYLQITDIFFIYNWNYFFYLLWSDKTLRCIEGAVTRHVISEI